ncbi:MAG: hypothetical protein ACREF7_00345, partial [Candidatus Saccharimonadales bacterium]
MSDIIHDALMMGRKIAIRRAQNNPGLGAGSDLVFLTRAASPPEPNEYSVFSNIFKDIPHAIIGGVAANTYMAPRTTDDMDFGILPKDAKIVHERLQANGWTCIKELAMVLDSNLQGTLWRSSDGDSWDIIEMGYDWAPLALQEVQRKDVGSVPILGAPYLVLMKLIVARSKDTSDLQRILGNLPQGEWAKTLKLVMKYLPQDLD